MHSPLVTRQLSLRIQPSAIFCLLVSLVHGAAGLGLWLTGLPSHWSVALGLMLLASWLNALLRDGLRLGAKAITGLRLQSKGWSVTSSQGKEVAVTLVAGKVVTSWLVLMRFSTLSGQTLMLALLPDSLPAESFRHIRAILRLGLPVDSERR